MKKYVRQAKLPQAAYDESRDFGKAVTKIKSRKGDEGNAMKHWPSCRCKACFKL